jgi:hypothetical protein
MKQDMTSSHHVDDDGNPAGGQTSAMGMILSWQNGPLGRGKDRLEPNGCFVETVIEAAKDRLSYYQGSKFECVENSIAIHHLNKALENLEARTANREVRQVEGTHEV